MLKVCDIPPALRDHLDQASEVLGGRLRVRGTRISVEQVLELLQAGVTPAEIVRSFSSLTMPDVAAVERLAAYCALLALQPA